MTSFVSLRRREEVDPAMGGKIWTPSGLSHGTRCPGSIVRRALQCPTEAKEPETRARNRRSGVPKIDDWFEGEFLSSLMSLYNVCEQQR